MKEREGILGNIVLDKEVVVVADILNIMDREIAKLSQGKVTSETEENAGKVQEVGAFEPQNINILFAEDTAFFRKQVVKTLTKHGYNVVTAVDGQEALDMVNKSERSQFDLILSDIEMPNLTGYELAEKVRTTDHFSDIPMIALTTRFKQRDIERGKEAGFTLYLEKLNEEILINALNGIFQEKRSA